MSWWWQLVRELLPLSWMLLPAPAVLLAPSRYLRPVSISAGLFYLVVFILGYFVQDRVCGEGCAAGLLIVPMFLLGVILTGIAFVIRASLASRRR